MTAGTLLWRQASSGGPRDLELALVHRPRYDDWTWPKGGVEPGESLLAAAARETQEETGHVAILGPFLGTSTYSRAGGRTSVAWWSATTPGNAPVGMPDPHEVDALRWLSPETALRRLTYRSDRAVLKRFLTMPRPTATVLLVRHASAGRRSAWSGPDSLRPLDDVGQRQAVALAAGLLAYRPVLVSSADLLRCKQTVTPLAARLGTSVTTMLALADDALAAHPTAAATTVLETAASAGRGAVALCSQGETIPAVVATLIRAAPKDVRPGMLKRSARTKDGTPRARKGSVWVLGITAGDLVTADYFADVSPVVALDRSLEPL